MHITCSHFVDNAEWRRKITCLCMSPWAHYHRTFLFFFHHKPKLILKIFIPLVIRPWLLEWKYSIFVFQESHSLIPIAVLDREVLSKFKEKFLLSSWLGYSANDGPSIEAAYRDFFEPLKSKPEKVQHEANSLLTFLYSKGISIEKYIQRQSTSYVELSKFIDLYDKYCRNNLKSVECEVLINTAPSIDEEFKPVIVYMRSRIRL